MTAHSESAELHQKGTSELVDELLAVRCQLGDAGALDELVDRWHAPLWRFVRRMLPDDETASETLQDIWLRVLRNLPALRDPSRLRPWLFGIARRAVMDQLRVAYAEPGTMDVDPDTLAAENDVDDTASDVELMHETLAGLPVGARETLALFYLQELSLNQMAEVLAIPVGTVKSRLFNARALLRRAFNRKD